MLLAMPRTRLLHFRMAAGSLPTAEAVGWSLSRSILRFWRFWPRLRLGLHDDVVFATRALKLRQLEPTKRQNTEHIRGSIHEAAYCILLQELRRADFQQHSRTVAGKHFDHGKSSIELFNQCADSCPMAETARKRRRGLLDLSAHFQLRLSRNFSKG